MKKLYCIAAAVIIISTSNNYSQTRNNLEVFESLIEKSVVKTDSTALAAGKEKFVKISLPQTLEQLNPYLVSSFKKKGFVVNADKESNLIQNYTLTNAAVTYKNSYKDGLFGDVMTEREVRLEGAHFMSTPGGFEEPVHFIFTNIDSVIVDEISALESKSIPFTQGEIPNPPLISNILEPIIVVGTLITTVILLFTVRSK